jgi:predicted nucleic acid-binding protein
MIRDRAVCVDASALGDLLGDQPRGRAVAEVMAGVDSMYAPDLINAEVLTILRRLERTAQITPQMAAKAVANLELSPIERVPTTPMAEAIWRLRHNVSPRDACYIVTARAFDVPLLTADLRLARAPKLGIRVIAV